MGELYRIGEDEVVVGVSVGIDIAGRDLRSVVGLLKNADVALYTAQNSAPQHISVFCAGNGSACELAPKQISAAMSISQRCGVNN